MQNISPFQRVEGMHNTKRSDAVYECIKDSIVNGTLPTGYTFPNENEMCNQLQVSRSTLREAYQSLAASGLIKRSKAGTVVNKASDIIDHAPFNIILEMVSFTDALEFRIMLESENAKYAATRATEEEISQMAKILSESKDASKDFLMRKEYDLRFHRLIAQSSHNPLLINVFSDIWKSVETLVTKNYNRLVAESPLRLTEAINQHSQVLDAIINRDPKEAKNKMKAHLVDVYSLDASAIYL